MALASHPTTRTLQSIRQSLRDERESLNRYGKPQPNHAPQPGLVIENRWMGSLKGKVFYPLVVLEQAQRSMAEHHDAVQKAQAIVRVCQAWQIACLLQENPEGRPDIACDNIAKNMVLAKWSPAVMDRLWGPDVVEGNRCKGRCKDRAHGLDMALFAYNQHKVEGDELSFEEVKSEFFLAFARMIHSWDPTKHSQRPTEYLASRFSRFAEEFKNARLEKITERKKLVELPHALEVWESEDAGPETYTLSEADLEDVHALANGCRELTQNERTSFLAVERGRVRVGAGRKLSVSAVARDEGLDPSNIGKFYRSAKEKIYRSVMEKRRKAKSEQERHLPPDWALVHVQTQSQSAPRENGWPATSKTCGAFWRYQRGSGPNSPHVDHKTYAQVILRDERSYLRARSTKSAN